MLIFSEWVEMLKLCAKRLDRLRVSHAMLHGGIPTDRRPALLDRFRDPDGARVLLSTEAGGVGLNLQVASYVIHLDLPWNPARLDQRTARAHRMGQTRGVTVTYLCAEGGIERGIEGVLAAKRSVRAAALDAASTTETLETPSFNAMLAQVREVLEQLEEPGVDAEVEIVPDAPSTAVLALAPAPPEPTPDARAPALGGRGPNTGDTGLDARSDTDMKAGKHRATSGARERLRLARVVLGAGFPADAARAAYEALARAIAGLLEAPPEPGHGALVAAVYRELLPAGRLPVAAHAALAMLHDLSSLDAHGVPVDADLAARAVDDAEHWVDRLCAPLERGGRSNGEHLETIGESAPVT